MLPDERSLLDISPPAVNDVTYTDSVALQTLGVGHADSGYPILNDAVVSDVLGHY
jgi:hypothetical protein